MHQELDSSDIFGYLHGSVSNATPTSLRSTTGERGIDWSHQTFSSSSSPSGLLARVSRKRQKIEHEAAADGDCFVVSATKPASEPLLLHEFRVTEDSKAPGREKRGKKELLKKVLPKRGNSPPPTIASQFFERGRPERLENETWYRGLGTVEGIAALKEALARAELEAPALVWGAQLRGAPSSGNRQDVLTALGSLSQPEPSNGYWRPLACNSFLTADESETCSSPLGWWLLCPELPSSKCSGNAVSARLFLSPDEVLKCLHARTSDPHQGVDIPPVRQTFEWRTVSGSELRRRKKKVDRANFKLQIQCNRDDPCAEQPPHFREFPLRKEQLRSLWWMQQQEKANTLFELTLQRHRVDPFNPAQVIPPAHVQAPQHRELHWQIEVVHRAFYNIRGGILGDAPGYGKTATTIGLVDAGVEGPPEIPSDQQPYFFHSKASLVLVPSNLLEQWLGEIQKFTAGTMKVIAIKTVANLKSLTVAQLCDAALVLCSYRLLYSKVYRHRLQQLAGLALAVETTDQATTETGPVDLRSLRRNTRRFREDVRSLLWGEEINDPSQLSFPVLEQLWWRRIVLDEFHELEAMGNTAQFESLRSIHAHYRWGLTGTPPTRDLSQVATLAKIFHLGHLPLEEKPPSAYRTDLAQEMCQHFLDHFARQNTSEEVTPVPLKEHILVVDPTPEERAIYLQCSRDVSDASGALTDEDRAERLIKLCSHFAAYCGLATAAADATGECHRIISTKQEHAKKTYNVALQRAVQLELLWQRLDAAQYRHSDQQDVCRSLGVDSAELGAAGAEGDAKVAEVGTWTLSRSFSSPVVSLAATVLLEASRMPPGQLQRLSGKPLEISDLASAREAAKGRMVSAAQTALSAQRSVEFFKRTLAAARGEASAEQRSCSICLEEDLTEDQLSITVCAHVFHTDCLNEVVKHFGTCPVCRHGLTGKNKVTSLAAELAPALPAVRSDKGQKRRLSSDTSETSKKAGSKLAALAVHLQSISAGEKVLVFCQWEDLKKHISDTLQSMGVPHFQLIGNLFQRAEILRRFQEESHESAVRVLLLSLEHAASGTNLTAANHVVFVHPMHAASPEKAVAYEAQAIARCRRYGQEKTVHCWRLVARGTIEETITATHQKDLWQDHVARSAPTSGGA